MQRDLHHGLLGRRRLAAAVLMYGLAALGGTGSPPAMAAGGTASARAAAPLHDLDRDEALGGHTIERHTGKSDEELALRLSRERHISAASTYTDVETARRVVAAAIEQSKDRLDVWARRSGARPNLVLNYVQRGGRPIGRVLARGERVSRSCMRALVVIRWHQRRGTWYVLTSYPEAGR